MLFGRQERLERLREFDIQFDDLRPTSSVWNSTLSKLLCFIFNFKQDSSLISTNGETPFPILMHFLNKVCELSNMQLPFDSYTVVTSLDVQVMYEVIDPLINICTFISTMLTGYADKYFATKNETLSDLIEDESRVENDLMQIERDIAELDKQYASISSDSGEVKQKIKLLISRINKESEFNIDEAVLIIQDFVKHRDQVVELEESICREKSQLDAMRKKMPNFSNISKYDELLKEANDIKCRMNQNKEEMFQLQMFESKTRESLIREIESLSDSLDRRRMESENKVRELSEKKQKLSNMTQKIVTQLKKFDFNQNDYYSSILQHFEENKKAEHYEEIMDPFLVKKLEDQKNFWEKGVSRLRSRESELKEQIEKEVIYHLQKVEAERFEIEKENEMRIEAIRIIEKLTKDFKEIVEEKVQ